MSASVDFIDLTLADPGNKGYSSVTFDGRYLYFAPMSNNKGVFFGRIARHDTLGDFRDPSSWEYFNTAGLNPNSRGFVGCFFDGRYLYLIPFHHDRHHGQVTRFDTRLGFTDPESWSFFDLQQHVDESCRGFVSGAFDGRFLYLSPYQHDWTTYNGHMVCFDTTSEFQVKDNWHFIDSQSIWPESRGFHSAVSAAGYTYFVPYVRENRDYHGLLVRFRQNGTFHSPEGWESVDLTSFEPSACGFVGGCYDGKYLYLAPYYNGVERHGLAARYDTRKPIVEPGSWEFFDMTRVHSESRGFFGALVYGSYVYFLPHCKAEGIYHGQISRYDRRLPFHDPNAWNFLDTAAFHPKSMGYMGGAVVGSYLYLAPYETAPFDHSGLVCRVNLDNETVWKH